MNLKRILKILKKYRLYIAIVLALTFIDVLVALYLPNLMSQIVDIGIINGDRQYIMSTGLKMLVISLVSGLGMVASSYFSSKSAMGFSRDLREKVFSHISNFSMGEFKEMGTSSLITRTTNDINQIQQVVMMALRMMVRAPLMLIGGLIMAISKNAVLSLVLLVSIPILIISVMIVGRRGIPLFKKVQKDIDNLNLVLREKLTGVRVIRAFDRVDYERDRFEEASEELYETSVSVNKLMFSLFPIINLILNFTTIAIVWFGARQADLGNMMIGDIMAFIQYIMLIMFSLIMFSAIFVVVPRAAASLDRINEVLDVETSIKDLPSKAKLDQVESLEFEEVSFCYPDAEMRVLKDINFKVKKGETLAIIGSTGSGKTSLINLIVRFYEANCGKVKINNIDIKDYSLKDLRDKIGFVPQTASLFSGTIKENIMVGKKDASMDEVRKAAIIAEADGFIKDLEEGYDSEVAQGGANFSGGQKQRLSLARALVKDADIYIFDDSFSALDFKTDSRVRSKIKENIKDSILIIVGQRITSVKDADKILVLEDGAVAGYGSHKELLNSSETYKEIVRSQLSQEEIDND